MDAAYQSIFQTCCDHVKEQREYIEQLVSCIDTGGSFVSFEKMEEQMFSASKELSYSKVLFYMDKFRNSEGNNEYDYNYLREIMNTDPNGIPLELYAALVYTFNEMNLSDKEKFIECAYILKSFSCTPYPSRMGAGKHTYEVSDVLRITADIYGQMMGTMQYDLRNTELQKIIGEYTLLRAVCEQGSSIHVDGFYFAGIEVINDLDLTLKNNTYENDYCLEFDGSYTLSDEMGKTNYTHHTIDTYSMKEGNSIDAIFDDYVLELAESLRVNIGQEQFETIVSGAADLVMNLPTLLSAVMTVSDTATECFFIEVEGNSTNATVDQLQELLIHGNTYDGLDLNASFSISDGRYHIYYGTINKKKLNDRLKPYTYYTKDKLNLTLMMSY